MIRLQKNEIEIRKLIRILLMWINSLLWLTCLWVNIWRVMYFIDSINRFLTNCSCWKYHKWKAIFIAIFHYLHIIIRPLNSFKSPYTTFISQLREIISLSSFSRGGNTFHVPSEMLNAMKLKGNVVFSLELCHFFP